jgi:isoleucyl-tRNA synthetase
MKLSTRSGEVEIPVSALRLKVLPREGYEVGEKDGVFVAISKERDDRLVAEGLMRDVARRLQALRKEKGFAPTALLGVAAVGGLEDEDLALLRPLLKELAFLVRVRRVELSKETGKTRKWSEDELDGKPLYLHVG